MWMLGPVATLYDLERWEANWNITSLGSNLNGRKQGTANQPHSTDDINTAITGYRCTYNNKVESETRTAMARPTRYVRSPNWIHQARGARGRPVGPKLLTVQPAHGKKHS